MAFHPAEYLGPVFKQVVGKVRVFQRGQRQVLGLDEIEVVTQLLRKDRTLVAARDRHCLPALRVGIGFGGRIDGGSIPGSEIPAPIGSAHRVARFHGKRGHRHRRRVRGRKRLPATGVGVVLGLEHKALFGNACAGREHVGLTRRARLEVAGHQLHQRACCHRQRHIFQIKRRVVILLGRVEPERCLLGIGEIGANPACAQLFVAIDHIGQKLHECAVIDARLDLGLIAHRDGIDAVVGRVFTRIKHDGRGGHHQSINRCALAFAEARLREQRHIADRLDRTGATDIDHIAFSDFGRAQRNCAAQTHQRGIDLRLGEQDVGDTQAVLPGHQPHIVAQHIGVGEADGIVGIHHCIGARKGARDERNRQHIGRRLEVGVAAGGEIDVAAQIADLRATRADGGAHLRLLIGLRNAHCKAANPVHPHLVDDVGVGIGIHLEHAGLARGGLNDQFRTLAKRHVGTEPAGAGADIGVGRQRGNAPKPRRARP